MKKAEYALRLTTHVSRLVQHSVSGQDSECGASAHQHLHVSVGTALAVGRVNIYGGDNVGRLP